MKELRDNQSQLVSLINSLTVNEDERQDLWVAYLSGTPTNYLSCELERIRLDDIEELKPSINQLLTQSIPPHLLTTLNQFSDFEKRVIYHLLLGLSVDSIARYNKLSSIRVEQTISTIRKSSLWDEYLDGTKKEIYRSRGIRSYSGRA